MALKDDQRAGAVFAHVAAGGDGLADGLLDGLPVHLGLGEPLEEGQLAAAHLLQHPADLRLEEDNQRQNAPLYHVGQGEVQSWQTVRGQPQRRDHHQHALEQTGGIGFPHQQQQPVNQIGDHQDVHHIQQPQGKDEVIELVSQTCQHFHDIHGAPSIEKEFYK